jgi:hypothetical protein
MAAVALFHTLTRGRAQRQALARRAQDNHPRGRRGLRGRAAPTSVFGGRSGVDERPRLPRSAPRGPVDDPCLWSRRPRHGDHGQ